MNFIGYVLIKYISVHRTHTSLPNNNKCKNTTSVISSKYVFSFLYSFPINQRHIEKTCCHLLYPSCFYLTYRNGFYFGKYQLLFIFFGKSLCDKKCSSNK